MDTRAAPLQNTTDSYNDAHVLLLGGHKVTTTQARYGQLLTFNNVAYD